MREAGTPTNRTTVGWLAVVAAVVVALDLAVKWLVTSALGPDADRGAWWLIEDAVGLEYVRNSGAAFGIFRGNAELLAAVSIVVATGLAWLIVTELQGGWLASLAGGLLVGGAAGNLVERITDGFVTDYLAVGGFPRFNVADAAITVAVGLFLLGVLRDWLRETTGYHEDNGGAARDRGA